MKNCSAVLTLAALIAGSVALAAPAPRSDSVQPSSAVTGSKVSVLNESPNWRSAPKLYAQAREICFLKGEKTEGMNKICFYDCTSGGAAITVSAVSLCPLNIKK